MSDQSPNSSLSYKQAGVDIDAGNEFVDAIKPLVAATRRAGVMTDIGGFGGLFQLPSGLQEPILVSGTDGVGTKLLLAREQAKHDTIGIDLVAMCVNDVLVQGAEPLFFLDYFACGKLETTIATQVVAGISAGCQLAGCALIGGETAEMPGMYADGDYDLAGFSVGVVERAQLINGTGIKPGDQVIGLESSGPHSNGYSLIRSVVAAAEPDLQQACGDTTLIDALLAPTYIYVPAVQACLEQIPIAGMAHITGGGLAENLARVLPDEVSARIDPTSWELPPVFEWLARHGPVDAAEMRRVFNCGIGYTMVVSQVDCDQALQICGEVGFHGHVIGEIVARAGNQDAVSLIA